MYSSAQAFHVRLDQALEAAYRVHVVCMANLCRGSRMTFDELFTQVLALLQRDGRVSYRVLRRRFDTALVVRVYNTAIRSTSIRAPGRSNAFTPTGVTAGR
jgi:hypothetical protein